MREIVSVALATYNGARFLRAQLDSLYSQTRLPDEIIVSDDCSTDNTISILEEYKEKGNLYFFKNEGKHGVNNNFFNAISLCKGDYIAICDQDDIWLPQKIERMLIKIKSIERNGIPAIVTSKSLGINTNGDIIAKQVVLKDCIGYARTFLYSSETCQGCCVMFNRTLADYVLKKYSDLQFSMDYLIYDAFISYTCAMIGEKYDMGEQLLLYRHHDNNVLGKNVQKGTFKERLSSHGNYVNFIPDDRFLRIRRVYDIVKNDVVNPNVILLIKKIEEIEECKSVFRSFAIILKIRELNILEKINIFIRTGYLHFLLFLFSVKAPKPFWGWK